MSTLTKNLSIYQIYPRSFADANGDGIGDLPGIIDKLPYIAELNIDAVWISPFYPSPMKDLGYDVSNFYDIDPIFGTLEDFDNLISAADKLGLRILTDMVFNHTSDQHPWYIESSSSNNNNKADWYVWIDGEKGKLPNNWLSVFGGNAWTWHEGRRQYYMHNFLSEQPDLNLHNLEVQQALLDVMHFWLKKGVGGFRYDVLNFYFHDRQLRDDPLLLAGEHTINAPDVNPYSCYQHLYSINQPENIDFIEKIRKVLDQYNAIGLGEIGADKLGHGIIAEYTKGDKRLHYCYDFNLLGGELNTDTLLKTIKVGLDNPDSGICNTTSNHDVIRAVSRWGDGLNDEDLDALIHLLPVLLVGMKGALCIYQGEELGLTEAEIPFEKIQDPYGKYFYPKYKGRDGCRTPMVWEHHRQNAGFSISDNSATPWLPIPSEHLTLAVNCQTEKSDSILNWYRKIIGLRRKIPALLEGTIEANTIGNLLQIIRRYQNTVINIYCNLGVEEELLDPRLAEHSEIIAYNYINGKLSAYGCTILSQN